MSEEFGGLSPEITRLMGIGRARAIADAQRIVKGEESLHGLTENDFRCDAEQIEVDGRGVITKSRPSKLTR
jgi:hypothetical protein